MQFLSFLLLSIPYHSNNGVLSRETASLANKATSTSTSSLIHDAIREEVIPYAATEEIRINRNINAPECQDLTAIYISQYLDVTGRVAELVREAPFAMTPQQHKAKTTSTDDRIANISPIDKHPLQPITPNDTAAYISNLDIYVCQKMDMEPDTNRRKHLQQNTSIMPIKRFDQRFDANNESFVLPAGYSDFNPYPTSINEADLRDDFPESAFGANHYDTMPSHIQYLALERVVTEDFGLWDDELAGIGAQFSS
jgi:hypothetical protein